MDVALLGPSGAGKGTHVDDLIAEFGYIHVSPGNIFRQNLENQTTLGLTAQQYMHRGELVPR